MSIHARTITTASRRAALVLGAVVALAIAIPGIVAAATSSEVSTRAQAAPWNQTCSAEATDILCSGPASRVHEWTARVSPVKGSVTDLFTGSVLYGSPPLDAESAAWMVDLHSLVCGAPNEIGAFIDKVGTLKLGEGIGPEKHGVCSISGDHVTNAQERSWFRVVSNISAPPSPRVTLPPTPAPTARPTAKPTLKPTLKPTAPPTPAPTATPAVTAPPTATPAAPVEPSATPHGSPSASAAPTIVATAPPVDPTPTSVAGESTPEPTATPEPTEQAAVVPTASPSQPVWGASVLGIADVSTDGGALGGSLLLALLLLLLIGFIGELFNNTVENNYDEISGWFRRGPVGRVRRALGAVRINPPGRPGVLLFIALTALVSSFVDRGFGLNVRSIAVFLGFLVGLIVVLASFKLPPILARRRRTGELGQLRPLPWALLIAALFVLISRIANLQPGYLYGIVLGAIFLTDATDREEGRETFWGSIWTLVAAIAAWLALTWLRGLGLPADGFGVTLLQTAFAATLVAGLEAAAFALMPLRFLPGYVLYKWNRRAWAVLWGVSLFAFFHILIGPTSGYVSELSPEGFLAALGVFAAFGALSIGTWLYFRFRNPPLPEPAEAA